MKVRTEKKNQHYLPQFYLRNFSFNSNNRQIGLLNTKSHFFHPTAPIRSQASKSFFYGVDGKIEEILQKVEGKLSGTVKSILNSKVPPRKLSIEHLDLLFFITLTDQRNPVPIENMKETRTELLNHLKSQHPDMDESVVPVFDHESLIHIGLDLAPKMVKVIEDLDYKLIINNTDLPFISSDFPIIKYNQFLERKGWPYGKTGYGQIGLQLFIPLSSNKLIIFFDPLIYNVGDRKRNTIKLYSREDVLKLNQLQFINCFQNIYFNENFSAKDGQELIRSCSNFKRANQVRSEFSYLVYEDQEIEDLQGMRNLFIGGTTDCETQLNLGWIKTTTTGSNIRLNPSMAQMRPTSSAYQERYS